jgi:hypothetical protein
MYRLDFSKDSQNIEELKPEDRFAVCIQAVMTATSPTSFDAWDDVIALLKKLKSIGTETKVGNIRTFDLNSGGGVIELQRGERTQLIGFIKGGAWVTEFLEKARGTLKWVEGLPEVEEEPKNQARTRPQRA